MKGKLAFSVAIVCATAFVLMTRCDKKQENVAFARGTFQLADVLPTGKCYVQPMQVRFSARATELYEKMLPALATNRDWLLDYVTKDAEDGKPLPYNTNFGLTELEYNEYLTESAKRKLVPSGKKAVILFARNQDILDFHTGGGTRLDKMWLNLKTGALTIAGREIPGPEWSSSDREDIAVGPWEGYQWKYEPEMTTNFTGRSVSLEILRRKKSGRILWIYEDRLVVNKESKRNYHIAFEHGPKGKD